MRGVIIAVLGIAGVIVISVIDIASTPTPKPEGCVLDRRIFLPDICVGSCSGKTVTCPPVTTRPYAIFFTQAATCPSLGLICLP